MAFPIQCRPRVVVKPDDTADGDADANSPATNGREEAASMLVKSEKRRSLFFSRKPTIEYSTVPALCRTTKAAYVCFW